jgi:two-component system chemotaxis response regulator CheB
MTASKQIIKVMVVDYSAVVRGLLTRTLSSEPDIEVVASATDGVMALNNLKRHDVHVVLLDIEMPHMDGITAIPKILELRPYIKIIMASTFTKQGAKITMGAVKAGAADYILKPSTTREINLGLDFKQELIEKVRNWGLQAIKMRPKNQVEMTTASNQKKYALEVKLNDNSIKKNHDENTFLLRSGTFPAPDAIAIGSSTGGPQALMTVLQSVKNIRQPVFITQHMPAAFTNILADHITKACPSHCYEAQDGMIIEGGKIYLAPGNFHMCIGNLGAQKVIRLNQDDQENFCRPAVDPMLRSLSAVYGNKLLVVMLTGMGSDGLKGSEIVVKSGGTIVAQDKETSIVWGMPGAVAQAGLCHKVLPLDQIGPHIAHLAQKGGA